MEIVLLKKYKPHSRELKVGTQMGVTQQVGLDLIKKRIARDFTKEYNADLQKKRDEDDDIVEEKKTTRKQKK